MDLLALIINDTIHVNSEEFQNFITLKNLEPKEDVRSETNTEMSTINSEDIKDTPSTSGYSVKVKEDMETSCVLITKLVKRGCGGSSVPKTAVVEPPMETSSAMYTSEQKEHRYRRRLQSNNAAFARYQKLKRKIEEKRKLKTQEADLKKRKAEQVKSCPEVASTTSMASCNSKNDPSILSFELEFLR